MDGHEVRETACELPRHAAAQLPVGGCEQSERHDRLLEPAGVHHLEPPQVQQLRLSHAGYADRQEHRGNSERKAGQYLHGATLTDGEASRHLRAFAGAAFNASSIRYGSVEGNDATGKLSSVGGVGDCGKRLRRSRRLRNCGRTGAARASSRRFALRFTLAIWGALSLRLPVPLWRAVALRPARGLRPARRRTAGYRAAIPLRPAACLRTACLRAAISLQPTTRVGAATSIRPATVRATTVRASALRSAFACTAGNTTRGHPSRLPRSRLRSAPGSHRSARDAARVPLARYAAAGGIPVGSRAGRDARHGRIGCHGAAGFRGSPNCSAP